MARRVRRQGRRQAILEAAMELYAKGGVRGTGLAAIGERVGVSHAAVLYHFGTSRNLLQEVIAERDRQASETLIPLFGEGGLAALRRLPEVARASLEAPGLAKLFTVLQTENLEAESEAHAYFLKRRRNLHRLLCGLLRAGQARGEFRRDLDVELKADTMIAFMEGAQLQQLLDPERTDLVALYEDFVAGFERDVAVEGQGGAPLAAR